MATDNPAAVAATIAGEVKDPVADTPGEATLLVSEFPPPPFYYANENVAPPPIPAENLARGTRRAAAVAARAREEQKAKDKTNAILGGATADEEEPGDVVAVFGEIVEDPMLVEPIDHCEDPKVIGSEVKRLNELVLRNFVQLVNDLVQNPETNQSTREDLGQNIFQLLLECNKFREHQARETMIELLQAQLRKRQELLQEINEKIELANDALN